jgi:hypothetical protein
LAPPADGAAIAMNSAKMRSNCALGVRKLPARRPVSEFPWGLVATNCPSLIEGLR